MYFLNINTSFCVISDDYLCDIMLLCFLDYIRGREIYMNKKLFTGFVSAALVCSMGISGVNAVTPAPAMLKDNQVSAASLSKSISDYKKINGINDQTVLGADFTH